MNPEQTTSTTQPAPAPTEPYKQSHVVWLQGTTIYSKRFPSLLEWSIDNRIRLYMLDQASNQYQLYMNVAPQEIAKFTVSLGVGTIKLTNKQQYVLEFSSSSGDNQRAAMVAEIAGRQFGGLIGGGLIGSVASVAIGKKAIEHEATSDLAWWKDTLSRFGIKGVNNDAKFMQKLNHLGLWVTVAAIASIIIVFIVAAITFG